VGVAQLYKHMLCSGRLALIRQAPVICRGFVFLRYSHSHAQQCRRGLIEYLGARVWALPKESQLRHLGRSYALTICQWSAIDNPAMPMSSSTTPIKIDAVAFQDPSGAWIAQCIQYDIVARANSLPELPKAIQREVVANLCINAKLGRKDLEGIPPAPEKYQEEFRAATLRLSPRSNLKMFDSSHSIELNDLGVVEAA
jgi:hypothetical protein